MSDFKIYENEGRQIIERLVYPRFKAIINFNDDLSDFEIIEMIDECVDVTFLASIMQETGEFIYFFKKTNN